MKKARKLISVFVVLSMIATMFTGFVYANETATVSENEAIVLGNSAFTWSATNDKKTSDAATDGTYSSCDWGSSVRTAEATFQVEKTGTYALSINAVTNLTLEGASAVNFSIDDGDVITMKTTDSTVTALATPWTTSNNWTVKNVAYNGDFVLEAGTHTLKFELQFSTVSSKVIYAFDCATLTPTNNLLAVKADATTTIGNQSFLRNETNDKKDNVNAYDGTYSSCNWGGAVRTLQKTFYVEKTGTYSFSINAVTDLTLGGASPVNFSVDGGGKITLTASNATVTALANPWKTSDNWTVKNIAYNGDFVLEEGLHTLEFEIPKRSAGDVVIYAFDCATIIPTNNLLTLSADTATTIGNLSFERSAANDKKENASAHDGTYSSSNWGGSVRTFKKTFYVAKKGTYKLDINAVIDLVLGGTAPMSFTIDGGNKVNLTSSNATVTALATPWQTNTDKWTVKNIAYNGEFVLEEGLHTLEFELQFNSANSRVIYAFDCATLTPVKKTVTVKSDEATTIGNMSFIRSEASDKKDHVSAYDGTYSSSNWGGSVRTATMMIEVEETGTYALDINAVTNLTLDGASPVNFSVDGGEKITLTASNATVTALENPWKTSDNWTVKNIAYNQDLLLEEGSHTITFEFPKRSAGDVVIYAFDCATLTPTNNMFTITGEDIETLGNSSFTWSYVSHGKSANAFDGTYTKVEGAGLTITATSKFYVAKAGEYDLEVYAASSITNINLSNLGYQIDEGESTIINTANATVRELSNPCRTDAPWTVKGIKLNDKISLDEGLHTITFTVPKNSNGRAEAYFVFDCVNFIPEMEDIQGIEAEVSDYTLAVGEIVEVAVTDTEGNLMEDATITSADSSVVSVGADKKLTAVGVGRTEITVSARKNEYLPEHTTSFDIYVGNNGIYVTSVAINAGTVATTFELDGVDASAVDVFVAVYDNTETKLLAVDSKAIVNGACSLAVGESEGKTVLFVWEKGTISPLYMEEIR